MMESIFPELEGLSLDKLKFRFENDSPETIRDRENEDQASLYFDEVARLIVEVGGNAGAHFLVQYQGTVATDTRLRAILQVLGSHSSPACDASILFRAYLHDTRDRIVSDAIDALAWHQIGDVRKEIIDLQSRDSPYIKLAVLRYLLRLFPEDAVPVLLEMLNSRHFVIRECEADESDASGIAEAIPLLIQISQDQHPCVRESVEDALNHFYEGHGTDF
jgi:HEAT repeat protein